LFLEALCRKAARDGGDPCPRTVKAASVEDALDDVVDGEARATVVDEVALDCFRRQKPGRFARLKVLKRSEVFPAAVLAYSPGAVEEATLRRLHDGLIRAGRDTRSRHLLTLCGMTAFRDVPEDYDRTLREIVQAYPPPAGEGRGQESGVRG